MIIRNITLRDYTNYTKLINSTISREDYAIFLDTVLCETHQLIVVEHETNIIGVGTIFCEKKMTFGGCIMGHIENILIDDEYQGKGYGGKVVKELLNIANQQKCYRVDLNCNSELKNFYNKYNLTEKNICMNIYFEDNFN